MTESGKMGRNMEKGNTLTKMEMFMKERWKMECPTVKGQCFTTMEIFM